MQKQEFEKPIRNSKETLREIKEFQEEWKKEIATLEKILTSPVLLEDERKRLERDLAALRKLLADSEVEERKLNAQNN